MPSERKVRPNDTRSVVLRRVLRKAGIENLVKEIRTGRNATWVRIAWTTPEDLETETSANAVAEALRPLWMDGDTRVKVVYGGTVYIDRENWWKTLPNTPEGVAQLEAEERELNEFLLTAVGEGKKVRACTCFSPVEYAPSKDDPRKPWVSWTDRRFTPWQVFATRN